MEVEEVLNERDKIANIVKLLDEKSDKCKWTRSSNSYVCRLNDYTIMLMSSDNTFTHLIILDKYVELFNSVKIKYENLNTKYAVHNTYLALYNKIKSKTHNRDVATFKEIMDHLDNLK